MKETYNSLEEFLKDSVEVREKLNIVETHVFTNTKGMSWFIVELMKMFESDHSISINSPENTNIGGVNFYRKKPDYFSAVFEKYGTFYFKNTKDYISIFEDTKNNTKVLAIARGSKGNQLFHEAVSIGETKISK